MIRIEPFRAFRPAKDKAKRVVTRTADSYGRQERDQVLRKNPESFLHVILPEAGKKQKGTRPNTPERFALVRERFDSFCEKEVFFQEESAALYIYELQKEGEGSFTGLIGGAHVDDMLEGRIRKHEQTLEKREELLKEYLKVCDINADPVLLCHQKDPGLSLLLEKEKEQAPAYDFITEDDGAQHRLWPVFDHSSIQRIRQRFQAFPALYIADGHHRSASSVRLAQEIRERREENTGEEGFERFMAYFLPEDQLIIHGYHRLVTDLNEHSENAFLAAVQEHFQLEPATEPVEPDTLHTFGLYLNGEWYRMYPHPGTFSHDDPVGSLDASILYEKLLLPVLGVKDPRKSERVHFHGAPKGMKQLIRSVDEGRHRVAFTLAPVPVEQLKEVADRGEVMPPKTTWIEPKLRSGLLIYRMGLYEK